MTPQIKHLASNRGNVEQGSQEPLDDKSFVQSLTLKGLVVMLVVFQPV